MKKEVFAKAQYIQDIQARRKAESKGMGCAVFVIAILLAMIGYLIGSMIADGMSATGVLVITATSGIPLIFVVIIVIFFKFIRRAGNVGNFVKKKTEFEIIEVPLKKAIKDAVFNRYQRYDDLVFDGCDNYRIPHMRHYKWSNSLDMSADGIYNTSIPDDIFYVVIRKGDKRKRPLMIYNKKFFEYSEDAVRPTVTSSWRDSVSLE